MQLTCRRCQGAFTTPGAQMTPCPACGSIDVAARSPMAATAERPAHAFSAPVSQPVAAPSVPPPATIPLAPLHAQPMVPYAQAPIAPSYPAAPVPYGQPYPPPPTYPVQYPPAVNVVIQNQITAPAYAPVPYALAPYARRKDAGVATLLSFFLPGAGQLYNGQVGKGLAFLLVSIFVNFPLMFIGVGFLTGLVTWIWAMADAHSSAEKINRGEIVV